MFCVCVCACLCPHARFACHTFPMPCPCPSICLLYTHMPAFLPCTFSLLCCMYACQVSPHHHYGTLGLPPFLLCALFLPRQFWTCGGGWWGFGTCHAVGQHLSLFLLSVLPGFLPVLYTDLPALPCLPGAGLGQDKVSAACHAVACLFLSLIPMLCLLTMSLSPHHCLLNIMRRTLCTHLPTPPRRDRSAYQAGQGDYRPQPYDTTSQPFAAL